VPLDALKHGNAYGASPHGGVLVVAGDDHGCVSSSMPLQSDVAFMAWFMPTLNPSDVAEYLSSGEYGYALSRFSGMWVGFKAISETVESGASVELPERPRFLRPDIDVPAGGKILFNDAVAMTGGQPVEGPISVQAIAHEVRANGVKRIAVVSDDPGSSIGDIFLAAPPSTRVRNSTLYSASCAGWRASPS